MRQVTRVRMNHKNNDADGVPTKIDLRFPGMVADPESGLYYNWNRYYDPKIGRYITLDPVGLAGGMNTYGYVRNNPLRYTDPSGLLDPGTDVVLAVSRVNPVVGSLCAGAIVGTIIYNTFDKAI